MPINKQIKINNEYFSGNDFQDIMFSYLIKMFNISNKDFKIF